MEEVYKFGTRENMKEIRSAMDKLLICIELGNQEKAENFAGEVKNLIGDSDKELKKAAFRLELVVRRGDHDKSLEQYGVVKDGINKYKEMIENEH